MIGYRKRTSEAAKNNAKEQGLKGAKWVWESAFSGTSATGAANQEIHLQAGIAMAIRQHYRVTHDRAWLVSEGWPMLMDFVAFFLSRAAVETDGSMALKNVESPNEYASNIDNDIYTNCAFAAMLAWIGQAARIVGVPDTYSDLGRRIVIPFNATLNRHEEYTGAPQDLRIKQATVTMVPYPVMFDMPVDVQRNDLVYEAAHIGSEGPAMTHSMLAIDWLAMGNASGGDLEFRRSFESNVFGPYFQWMECPLPPDFCQNHRPATNFLTAAGGFTQTLLFGFVGLRYHDSNMTMTPTLMRNVTRLAVRGVRWSGALLDVDYTAGAATIARRSAAHGPKRPAAVCVEKKRLEVGASISVALPATITVSGCDTAKLVPASEGLVQTDSDSDVTYTKLANTDTTIPSAKRGACGDGTCQSLRCATANACGVVPCHPEGQSSAGAVPCDIAALEKACTADPRCGGFNSDGWLKPCVGAGCGAKHTAHVGVDTYLSSRSVPPPPPPGPPSPPGPPPPVDPLPLIEDWHYPREEQPETKALFSVGLRVTALSVESNTTGAITLTARNGSTASATKPGENLLGWELRGFLTGSGSSGPMAILQFNAERWGMVAYLGPQGKACVPGDGCACEPGAAVCITGGRLLRKGVGRADSVRRPHYNLVAVDPQYYAKAVADAGDFIKQGMENTSAFGETTFAAAASRLVPPHDYAIVGNVDSHTKFSVAQDGRVKLANFSIYSPTLLGNDTAGTGDETGRAAGGPVGDVLLFDPKQHVSWWPAHNFSDYKSSVVGRYTRAITLAAWDQAHGAGFAMTAVPNTRRGIETQPYDTSELLIELEEHGHAPRYFAVRGCVTSDSVVAKRAANGRLCDGGHGCRLLALCGDPADSTTRELADGALYHANLLEHCGSWQDFFAEGMQVSLRYDASEASRVIDMGRGVMAASMSTWIGTRPNYGDGTNYWSVNSKDRGSLPLESYALDHALLLWGFRSEAAARIGWYLQHYVRGADGVTPQQLTPGSNWTKASPGPPGSIDLKHWEDSVFFADSFADYGRWVELWIDTARAQEAAGEAQWVKQTWPQVKLMATYMLALRANATTSGVGKGLIWGPAEHDTARFETNWFSISGWTWRGFVQLHRFLSDTAAISEPALAAQLAAESASFKADLDAARDASLVRDPSGKPFFMPPFASTNFTPYPSMTQNGGQVEAFGGGASYSNFRYFSEMLSAQFMGDDIDAALNSFRESHGGTLSGMTRFRDHLDDMPANGYAFSAIATDRVPSYLSLLFGHLANYQSRGTFNAPEQLGLYGDGGSNAVKTYSDSYRQMLGAGSMEVDINMCVPSTMLGAHMLRWMLVFEQRDSDTLWLLKAAPRRLYPNATATDYISVSAAPTRFGDVSFSVSAVTEAAGPLRLMCKVALALNGRGMLGDDGLSLKLRLRDPQGTRQVRHATVSGADSATLGQLDAASETVEVKIAAKAERPDVVAFSVVAVLEDTVAEDLAEVVAYDPVEAQRLILLSDASYCGDASHGGTSSLVDWSCPPCRASAPLGGKLDSITIIANATRQTLSYVGLSNADPQQHSIVVVFRGSVLQQNFIDDHDQQLLPLPNGRSGRVHRGMFSSYASIADPTLAAVDRLRKANPAIRRIVVTGHSLGAGQAVFFADDVAAAQSDATVTAYTFGTPRPGDAAFASRLNQTANLHIYAVVHRADTVPQCGIYSPPCDERKLGLHQIARNVWYPDGLAESGAPWILCDGSGEDPQCQDSVHQELLNWDDHSECICGLCAGHRCSDRRVCLVFARRLLSESFDVLLQRDRLWRQAQQTRLRVPLWGDEDWRRPETEGLNGKRR